MNRMDGLEFSAADLIPRLISEFGYPEAGARLIASKLTACTSVVKNAFWHWWQTGSQDTEIEIAGYKLTQLMNEHGMNPVAAFLTLDWLTREPDKARASLARGHDVVTVVNPD